MKEKVTIKDVAALAGVAPGTVSRVLSNSGYIKKETREKVMQAVKEVNYIPNRAGQNLKNSTTGLVALAVPDASNPVYFAMIEAFNNRLKQENKSMVLIFTGTTLEGELNAVKLVQEHQVDGLFLLNFSYSPKLRQAISECYPAPVVLCGMCNSPWAYNEQNTFDTISIDVFQGIYEMTSHYIEKGYRSFGCLAGESKLIVYVQRYQAYAQALFDNGLEMDADFVFAAEGPRGFGFAGGYDRKDGYYAAKLISQMDKKPEIVIGLNDLQAVGFYEGCRDLNLGIGDEIGLSGMDNIYMAELLGISSVDMHEEKIGETAASMILDVLNGKERENGKTIDVTFRPDVIYRDIFKIC